jgi:hypothetical protein
MGARGIYRLAPAAGLAALASCGIRLPDTPPRTVPVVRADGTMRTPVSHAGFVPGPGKEAPDVLVWLISDELHTGMVFDYEWLLESGFVPPAGFGHPKIVTLSWGDRTAYVEKGLHSPWKVFRALFTPTPSVMELIPARSVAEDCPHQRIWRKLVPRETGRDLAAFLNDCSVRDADGRPIVCGTSSWGGGVLLESRHIYFVPRICNIWTAQAIESLGGEIDPWAATTAGGLVRQAEAPPNDYEQIWWGR